jgi:hypothetical protein
LSTGVAPTGLMREVYAMLKFTMIAVMVQGKLYVRGWIVGVVKARMRKLMVVVL